MKNNRADFVFRECKRGGAFREPAWDCPKKLRRLGEECEDCEFGDKMVLKETTK